MSDNGMNENELNENEMDMDQEPVIFEDEDGNEYAFTPLDFFFYNGDEYALLSEETEEDGEDEEGTEVIVCRVLTETDENGEETETFELVEDEELAEKLVAIANTRMTEDQEEE
jgi:uncharacterized protein YrzB (UPF0473 family)